MNRAAILRRRHAGVRRAGRLGQTAVCGKCGSVYWAGGSCPNGH